MHRFPSTATPSFYLPKPEVRTEDDVIYRPKLPGFNDNEDNGGGGDGDGSDAEEEDDSLASQQPVLTQRDSELLISCVRACVCVCACVCVRVRA